MFSNLRDRAYNYVWDKYWDAPLDSKSERFWHFLAIRLRGSRYF